MLQLLAVFGTRPEVIKMAPVVQYIRTMPESISCCTCCTGQHREMIDPLLRLFTIEVDYELDVMRSNQTLDHITVSVIQKAGEVLDRLRPQLVLVQGDTTTSMAAAMAAFYRKIPVGHIEAGLRTSDKWNPFPEEVNRRIIDSFADLFFAHSKRACSNLLREGVPGEAVELTGNTVIDALLYTASLPYAPTSPEMEKIFTDQRKIVLVTAHRRENYGQPLHSICTALRRLACKYKNELLFVYPVHLNPNIHATVTERLKGIANITLLPPIEYLPFVHLMKKSWCILTDSGGLQEEGPSLGKPVIVLRKTTERPEGVEAGTVQMAGTDPDVIERLVRGLMEDPRKYQQCALAVNPYGDGTAAQRIVTRILREFA